MLADLVQQSVSEYLEYMLFQDKWGMCNRIPKRQICK